ncbi:MAG: CDP-alcohol phosphatidyltransferase family protein, partial [Burkholderiaceae bacterium]
MKARMPRRRQSIYLLPNLFTTACVFSGFYAIVMAINGQFSHAAVAIFVAMVLDSLDGRVARLTNTTSDFGAWRAPRRAAPSHRRVGDALVRAHRR